MASSRSMRRLAALAGLLGALTLPGAAQAAIPNVPNGAGGNITCTVQTGANAGQRHCSGIFTTFDGAPIDVNIGFPPAPASGADGDFPIVGMFHGWGGSKLGITSGGWINNGYAVFSMSDRGWGNSCGGTDPKRLDPVCLNGYNHLMDTRFEVRDAQQVFETLADQNATGPGDFGLIDPQGIGVTGGSYGGGISMALAALKDRKMVEEGDGTLVPWVSDGGKQMKIAAAQPDIPWTDLAYSLQPNGHTLDYVVDSPYLQRGRIGVMKQSFVSGLYGTGQATSNYAPPGTDPDADLTTWFASINAGDPYDGNPLSADIVDEITRHHSSYYIDHSTAPAPLLISNGFTDDLFPPDEAIRFYNRTRDQYPGTPVSLIFSDHGHQRGQNKVPDAAFQSAQLHNWFDYYVKGDGPRPFQGVQTLTQTCGGPSGGSTGPFDDANADLPFRAANWLALAPGEVHLSTSDQQAIAPSVADQAGTAFDPIAGGGACATAPAADQTGAASYRLAPAPAGGFTLMGSPTIVADVFSPSPTAQIAARLVDVDPSGANETLVARGLYRPDINLDAVPTHQVFQLHPNGWKFEQGHVAKLELLPADQPYGRNSNGQAVVTVSDLELRLPVLEQPNGGVVETPAAKVVPAGYELVQSAPPYDVPGGAHQLNVSLVPNFRQTVSATQCAARGGAASTHGAPLALASCNPPAYVPGTAARLGPLAQASASLTVMPGDLGLAMNATDVRDRVSGGDYVPNLAGADVTLTERWRLSDTRNGVSEDEPATTQDFEFEVGVECTATPSGSQGSSCQVATTANAVTPGAITGGNNMVIQGFRVRVSDSGQNASRGDADDRDFAQQGIYVR
jgi:hypothetical protein